MNDQKLILEKQVSFYVKLYFETGTSNCKFTSNLFFPQFSEKKNMECKKPITESECLKAVSELSNNMFPGLDGFSIEFYKMFGKIEKNISKKSQLHFSSKSALWFSISFYQILLIRKSGKNTMYIPIYRPITLLNCD